MSNEEPKPMDPSAPTGDPMTENTLRVCHALQQLAEEVAFLYPEVPMTFSRADGRNAMLDVTFDLSPLDEADAALLTELLQLIETDPRVGSLLVGEQSVQVSIASNPRTQDNRDSFRLNAGHEILTGGDEL